MSFDIGINFRDTSGYVTDGANETYCLAEAYPTTRGGVTFGWSGTIESRDRSNSIDRRLAGMNFIRGTSVYFQIDLPETGLCDVHIAAGDAALGTSGAWDLKDNSTTFQTLADDGRPNAFNDAMDTEWTAAQWPSLEVAVSHTFSSTVFRLAGISADNNGIAHIRIVGGGGGGGAVIPVFMNQYRQRR